MDEALYVMGVVLVFAHLLAVSVRTYNELCLVASSFGKKGNEMPASACA